MGRGEAALEGVDAPQQRLDAALRRRQRRSGIGRIDARAWREQHGALIGRIPRRRAARHARRIEREHHAVAALVGHDAQHDFARAPRAAHARKLDVRLAHAPILAPRGLAPVGMVCGSRIVDALKEVIPALVALAFVSGPVVWYWIKKNHEVRGVREMELENDARVHALEKRLAAAEALLGAGARQPERPELMESVLPLPVRQR